MKFDTANLNPVVEFTFPDQEELDVGERATISMRATPVDVVRKIVKAATTKKSEFKQPTKRAAFQRFATEEINDDFIYEESWDYVIVAWANINNEKGEPLECNKANKLLLFGNSPMFADQIQSWLDILESGVDEDKEANSKN